MKRQTAHFLLLLKRKNAGDMGTDSTQASKHGALRGVGQWGQSGDTEGTKWGHLYV